MGKVTSDDVADCIRREWAAARALDAERGAAVGLVATGRAQETTGCAGAGGTKRRRPTDDGHGGARTGATTAGVGAAQRAGKKTRRRGRGKKSHSLFISRVTDAGTAAAEGGARWQHTRKG